MMASSSSVRTLHRHRPYLSLRRIRFSRGQPWRQRIKNSSNRYNRLEGDRRCPACRLWGAFESTFKDSGYLKKLFTNPKRIIGKKYAGKIERRGESLRARSTTTRARKIASTFVENPPTLVANYRNHCLHILN